MTLWSDADRKSACKHRRVLAITLVLAITTLILSLVLLIVERLRSQEDSDSLWSHSTYDIDSSDPLEYNLSRNNFSISSVQTTRYYEWTISQRLVAPDGFERPMLLVNGKFPGPLVEANTGDRIVVKVTNNMVNGTAIHWHGMFQNGTNWMDGTTGVTQCPIPPGQSFTYNFTVPNQWGTYWWHAHAASQYIDGIVGPLIIHSPDEPHLEKYDQDLVMMVSDHYHTDSGSLVAWYLSTASEGVEPVPDNGLINGRKSFDCSMAPEALFPTTPGSGYGKNRCLSNAPRAVFEVEQGLRYRIRIINTGSFADFKVSVDEHELTVIEADGVDMVPVTVQRVPVHVAQRYSVLLAANHQTYTTMATAGGAKMGKSFWIRAEMNTNCFNVENPALEPSVKAILRYKAGPTPTSANSASYTTENKNDRSNNKKMKSLEIPNSKDWEASAWSPHCDDLRAEMLKPFFARDAPEADIQVVLEMSFMTISHDRVNKGYVNRTSWTPQAHNPTLFQVVDGGGGEGSMAVFNKSSQLVVTLNTVQNVELVVNNLDEGAHPFHLHGHVFYVVSTGDGSYMPGRSPLQTKNPLRRDTVTIPPFGYVVLRFVSDNPGLWAFHCHIDWHMAAGLMMQFLALPSQVKAFDIPSEQKALCGTN
ncbi:MAG: multi-copper oxidase laccase-like protein [Linnemannia gamsii]|nr:MAG: multi-copper oxidase laccase-like protein [Linnemannia gamsii]